MELTNVHKKIGKKEIIKGVNFSINKGEVFGFIGPNGAGKTTTIRMMVGLMNITEGDIKILGNSIKSNFHQAIKEVGAIVENPEMYAFMTGRQNLNHYARMNQDVTKDRVEEVIQLVGLEKAINEKVGKYSLGMRQRLGIAQALLHKPSILILDEPTNGLDPAGIREIRKYIRSLAENDGVSVIISSHLLSEIELMCDRIGVIQHGEIVKIQSLHESDEDAAGIVVSFEVDQAEQAKQLLMNELEADVQVRDHFVSVMLEKEKIPSVNKLLVDSNISVYQIQTTKETLEDQFFDLMGANTIE